MKARYGANMLDEYLSAEMPEDYWYDEALFICEDILMRFSIEEWHDLIETISSKNNKWKTRLAECLGNLHNSHELQCVISMIYTDNDTLFIACIDSLRNMDLSLLQKDEAMEIEKRIQQIIDVADLPTRKVLKEYLAKAIS